MAGKAGANDFVTYVTKSFQNGDSTVIGITVAVVVVLLTIVLLVLKSRSSNKRQGILLMGVCDSGKTLMFLRLVYKQFKQTHTSLTSNSGMVSLPNGKSLRVIDIPGYERLRAQQLDKYKGLARAIIFVVDASTMQKEVKEVAEYLYTVLTDSVVSQNAPPVLIACNKQDLVTSKGAALIQRTLEKEMNTLRVTQSAALQSTDGSGTNNNSFLGRRDKDFAFAHIKPLRVDFAECSARGKEETSEGDLKSVVDWMAQVA